MEPRNENYFLWRERDFREPNWVRPEDFKLLDLPRPVVIVNGAFDLLHSTHMRLIFAARHKAATLIAALDADDKIRREKGPQRPILNFLERLTALNYMPLDFTVEIHNTRDMNDLVKIVQPDLMVKGEEYKERPSRYPHIPRMLVREGKIHTTELIHRIIKRYEESQLKDYEN